MRKHSAAPASMQTPFTILVDSHEQIPYRFTGLVADAAQGGGPLQVHTVRACLETGDYTIRGLRYRVAVERKTLSDLFRSVRRRRANFRAEHVRLAAMDAAAVVIEAEYRDLLCTPFGTQLHAKTVNRTMLSWQIKYRVPWFWAGSVRAAEVYTFRFLESFWRRVCRERRKNAPNP